MTSIYVWAQKAELEIQKKNNFFQLHFIFLDNLDLVILKVKN